MPKIEAVIVSHTHWDREWYRPFQSFRYRLVEVVDQVLKILASDPEFRHFTLDGQTIILEDYLALRPQREAELRQHVQSGRLLIGPWYVLPDEFLVGAESTVRNLMLGRKVCQRFGARMAVGYIPDPFGHISQLPQILTLCGIDSAVFRRGLSHEPTELWWEAPDGSRVLVIYLRDGYGNAAFLPTDLPGFVNAIRCLVANLTPYSAIKSHVLLMNGNDHTPPRPDLPALIRAANAQLEDIQLYHGTLPQFIQLVKDSTVNVERSTFERSTLPVVRGELRSPKRHHLLPGVLSTRMWIKQQNNACEIALTRYAEPLAAAGRLVDGRDLREELWQAWRYLMENHPHDSICGCSIDQVHEEMKTRFAWSAQISEAIIQEGLQTLAQHVADHAAPQDRPTPDTVLTMYPDRRVQIVTVFNPTHGPRTDWVAFQAPRLPPGQTYRLLDANGRPVPMTLDESNTQLLTNRHLTTAGMTAVINEIESGLLLSRIICNAWLRVRERSLRAVKGGEPLVAELDLALAETGYPDLTAINRFVAGLRHYQAEGQIAQWHVSAWLTSQVKMTFIAHDVPSFGYQTYRLESIERSNVQRPTSNVQHPNEGVIENEFFRIQVSLDDGTLILYDKRTGLNFTGLNRLVDNGDRGDEYNHCPPPYDQVIDQPFARPHIAIHDEGPAGQRLVVTLRYRIPLRLTSDRNRRSPELAHLPVVSQIWLRPGVPRVDIETTVDNRIEDHRLRVFFPTPFNADRSLAESQFDIVSRSLVLPTYTTSWIEQPVPTAPQCAFVAVREGERGLLVANRGLPEYEVIRERDGATIALTLLRCVGWLSRDDLVCRVGHAGPSLPTPGAQCPGVHTFAYSLIPFDGPLTAAIHQAHAFRAPLRAVVASPGNGRLPTSLSFVDLAPAELVISAIKPADDGDGLIVRFWNTERRQINARLTTGFDLASADLVNLLEDRLNSLAIRGRHTLHLQVGGKQIVSVRLRPA